MIGRLLVLVGAMLCSALLFAVPASAEVETFANIDAITVPETGTTGPADVYPSSIDVGASGFVTHVSVTLHSVTHAHPDDLDVLLVGPQGQKSFLMSDAGDGGDLTGDDLTFDDAGATLPDETALSPGTTYKPGDYDPVDETLPPPAPAGPSGTDLSVFNGTNPNGAWKLYVFDDSDPDAGSIAGGWSMELTTTPPAGQQLVFPDNNANEIGNAAPYPLAKTVSGLGTEITKVTATVSGIYHSFPDDIDLLLVGPQGQKSLLMSDAGGNGVLFGQSVTFDDAAAGPLPDESQISSGAFRPTNYTNTDTNCPGAEEPFGSPAPGGPYPTSLASFNGTNPNGTWSLYALDDCEGDTGSIGNLTLNIQAVTPDTTKPKASVSVPKQKLSKVLKSGKLVEKVKTNEAGAISAQAVLPAKLAKKYGLPANGTVFTSAKKKVKPAIVAKGKRSASKAATYKVTLKLTSKARKKLAKLRKQHKLKSLKLAFYNRVADKAANRRLVKKSATLKG